MVYAHFLFRVTLYFYKTEMNSSLCKNPNEKCLLFGKYFLCLCVYLKCIAFKKEFIKIHTTKRSSLVIACRCYHPISVLTVNKCTVSSRIKCIIGNNWKIRKYQKKWNKIWILCWKRGKKAFIWHLKLKNK